MNVTPEIPARLPALVRRLIELGDRERCIIDGLVAAVQAGDQSEVIEKAMELARHGEATDATPTCTEDRRKLF